MIDFEKSECQDSTNETLFGICDGANQEPAYLVYSDPDTWIVTVNNLAERLVNFTAIDNCIEIWRNPREMESRCDAMLIYDNNIVFIELKEGQKNWIKGGIAQLRTTINIFGKNKDLKLYAKKRALLANRRKPHFHFSHKEEMQHFFNETGVRLLIHGLLTI